MRRIPDAHRRLLPAVLLACAAGTHAQTNPIAARVDDYAEIVRLIVMDLAPPGEFAAAESISIFLDLEQPITNAQADGIRAAYPASIVVKLGNEHVLDEKTQCFRDAERAVPALGIGVGTPRVMPDGDLLVEAGSASCIPGTVQNKYTLRRVDGRWKIVGVSQDFII